MTKFAPPNASTGSYIRTVIKLAKAFGEKLQEALTAREMRQVIDSNKCEPEDSGVCHSHDFCDANMVMLEAFTSVMVREPAFLTDTEESTDMQLWNDAWDVAVAADFFI